MGKEKWYERLIGTRVKTWFIYNTREQILWFRRILFNNIFKTQWCTKNERYWKFVREQACALINSFPYWTCLHSYVCTRGQKLKTMTYLSYIFSLRIMIISFLWKKWMFLHTFIWMKLYTKIPLSHQTIMVFLLYNPGT